MTDLQDPKVREVRLAFEERIRYFINEHAVEIVKQVNSDRKYQSDERDVPEVPLFDEYLSGLETEVQDTLARGDFPDSTAVEMIQYYRIRFYRDWLGNICANSLFPVKQKPDSS